MHCDVLMFMVFLTQRFQPFTRFTLGRSQSYGFNNLSLLYVVAKTEMTENFRKGFETSENSKIIICMIVII
jgi:hypothetical protein